MSLRIYTYPNNYRVNKALIAAQYVGVTIELPKFEMGKDNKTAEFKAKNPLQKVPVLETPNGCVFESNAIARYVARLRADAGLLGGSAIEQSQVDQWIDFSQNEFEPARNAWYYQIAGYIPANPKSLAEAKKETEKAMGVLNEVLLSQTFLVGNRVTLADITVFSAMVETYAKLLGPKTVAQFPNVLRWFNTLVNQPQFSKVVGKVEFAKDEAKVGEKKEEKKDTKKDDAKKAEPKKEAAPKAESSSLGDDEEENRPKKPKSELDLLPESSMGHIDKWKKLMFLKKPINAEFWDQIVPAFDKAGFSWFVCDYKFNAENTKIMNTGNAVGGFLQRSDAVRPYALGCLNVSGNPDEETPPFSISGAWMFRGTKVPKEMLEENPDSEYYDWIPVDITTPAGLAKIKEQFTAEKLAGGPVLDRRFFK